MLHVITEFPLYLGSGGSWHLPTEEPTATGDGLWMSTRCERELRVHGGPQSIIWVPISDQCDECVNP